MDTLGARIRYARKARDLSQQAIADHFGIRRVSVTQWENDQSKPSVDKLPELAKLLEVSEEWLISNKGEAPVRKNTGSASKLDELIEGFPKLHPDDQDLLLGMMRRLASLSSSEEQPADRPSRDGKTA
mgnify:CR=1 FL=1